MPNFASALVAVPVRAKASAIEPKRSCGYQYVEKQTGTSSAARIGFISTTSRDAAAGNHSSGGRLLARWKKTRTQMMSEEQRARDESLASTTLGSKPSGDADRSSLKVAERRAAMAIFARATREELVRGLADIATAESCVDLRAPEVGLVMAQGRSGGTGKPFNFGEVAVTRAAIQLSNGTTGHALVLGRQLAKARLAAIADACWQSADLRTKVEKDLLVP
ncbi:MAG: phosphonate C-P lyase system protein PhnG, partial [Hyphomicrobiaceae bacterium]